MAKKDDMRCSNCGCRTIIETITGGMTQKVWWNEDGFVLKEETVYEPNLNHSSFECSACHKVLD